MSFQESLHKVLTDPRIVYAQSLSKFDELRDKVLYIGVTFNVLSRLEGHIDKGSEWVTEPWGKIFTLLLHDRKIALALESWLISELNPEYNVEQNSYYTDKYKESNSTEVFCYIICTEDIADNSDFKLPCWDALSTTHQAKLRNRLTNPQIDFYPHPSDYVGTAQRIRDKLGNKIIYYRGDFYT